MNKDSPPEWYESQVAILRYLIRERYLTPLEPYFPKHRLNVMSGQLDKIMDTQGWLGVKEEVKAAAKDACLDFACAFLIKECIETNNRQQYWYVLKLANKLDDFDAFEQAVWSDSPLAAKSPKALQAACQIMATSRAQQLSRELYDLGMTSDEERSRMLEKMVKYALHFSKTIGLTTGAVVEPQIKESPELYSTAQAILEGVDRQTKEYAQILEQQRLQEKSKIPGK